MDIPLGTRMKSFLVLPSYFRLSTMPITWKLTESTRRPMEHGLVLWSVRRTNKGLIKGTGSGLRPFTLSRVISVIVFFASILVIFTLFYRNLRLQVFSYGDIVPFPSNPVGYVLQFFSAWQPTGLGHAEDLTGAQLIFAVLSFLAGNASQTWVHLLTGPLSAISMYALVAYLTRGHAARIISALIYGFNHYYVNEFIGGGAINLRLAYMLYPLVILYLLKFLNSCRAKHLYLFTLALGFSIFVDLYSIAVLTPFLIIISFFSVISRERATLRITLIKLLSIGILLGILLGSLYLGPSLFRFLSSSFVPVTASGFAEVHIAADTYTPFSSLARLLLYQVPLIPLAMVPLLVYRRRPIVMALSILTASLITFIWLTARGLTVFLFNRFTILNVFENPTRPIVMILLATIPLTAIALDAISDRLLYLKSNHFFHVLLICGLFSLYLLSPSTYNYPSGYPSLFSYMIEGAGTQIQTYYGNYYVNDGYYQTITFIGKLEHDNFYRTLWLPQGKLTVQTIIGLDPNALVVPAGYGRLNPNVTEFMCSIFSSVLSNDTDLVAKLLGSLSIKYVIIHLSNESSEPMLVQYNYGCYLMGSPEKFRDMLDLSRSFKRIGQNESFLIYENLKYEPLFTLHTISSSKESITSKIAIRQIGITDYFVSLNLTQPSMLVMGYSYDEGWHALANGFLLPHLKVFGWANGFMINQTGSLTVHISYEPQRVKLIASLLWGSLLVMLIVVNIYTSLNERSKKSAAPVQRIE